MMKRMISDTKLYMIITHIYVIWYVNAHVNCESMRENITILEFVDTCY